MEAESRNPVGNLDKETQRIRHQPQPKGGGRGERKPYYKKRGKEYQKPKSELKERTGSPKRSFPKRSEPRSDNEPPKRAEPKIRDPVGP